MRAYLLAETLAMIDMSISPKIGLTRGMFAQCVELLGSDVHRPLLPRVENLEIIGCFALVRRMQWQMMLC
jgi:acyl-CoA oxidase